MRPAPVDPELLRYISCPEISRKVQKHGIQYLDRFYTNRLLRPLIGKRVNARVHRVAKNRFQLEVMNNKTFVCTAVCHSDLTPREGLDIITDRHGERAADRRSTNC